MAERVGFAPLLRVENKALKGFPLPHDPLNPLESLAKLALLVPASRSRRCHKTTSPRPIGERVGARVAPDMKEELAGGS
jgi:hypothetical protein